MGVILIYSGRGKGKTSACIGQAIRALGSGLEVAFGQFMKRPGKAGEQAVLESLLGKRFFAAGAGFFRSESQRPEQREKTLLVLEWAFRQKAEMLVLDEALLALERGLLHKDELFPLVEDRVTGRHLVLSGPVIPDWLLTRAGIITEMRKITHALDSGMPPICGIEY